MKLERLKEIAELEIKIAELKKVVDAPETAKDFLLEILSNPFEVKITKGCITYYQKDTWVFQQDLKMEFLWYNYHTIYSVLRDKFSMKHKDIKLLIQEVVGEALNCKQLTPRELSEII